MRAKQNGNPVYALENYENADKVLLTGEEWLNLTNRGRNKLTNMFGLTLKPGVAPTAALLPLESYQDDKGMALFKNFYSEKAPEWLNLRPQERNKFIADFELILKPGINQPDQPAASICNVMR